MTPVPCRLLLVLAAALSVAGAARAEEKAPAIRDGADLFSASTITKALTEISDIRDTYHRDLVIETIKSPPPEEQRWFNFLRRHQDSLQMQRQARERAEKAGVDGILVLIRAEPLAVQVAVWPPAHGRFFNSKEVKALRVRIERHLREKHPDEALLDAVAQVRATFRGSLADRQPAEPASDWFLAAAGGIFMGFWLVLLVARHRMAAAGPAEPPELTTALLASRYGSVTGCWMYDKLFLAYRTALPAAPEPAEVPADEDADAASVESVP